MTAAFGATIVALSVVISVLSAVISALSAAILALGMALTALNVAFPAIGDYGFSKTLWICNRVTNSCDVGIFFRTGSAEFNLKC